MSLKLVFMLMSLALLLWHTFSFSLITGQELALDSELPTSPALREYSKQTGPYLEHPPLLRNAENAAKQVEIFLRAEYRQHSPIHCPPTITRPQFLYCLFAFAYFETCNILPSATLTTECQIFKLGRLVPSTWCLFYRVLLISSVPSTFLVKEKGKEEVMYLG